MADVLAPIVGSTNTMTILRSPQDAYHSNQSSQPHMSAPRIPQMPRNSMYNPQLSATGYRGAGVAISPYAFNTTPPLRDLRRMSAGPVLNKAASHSQQGQKTLYHGSSSSSVSSASSSSNRSAQFNLSQDDSVLGYKDRQPGMPSRLSTNAAASLSSPDLSLASVAPKPSPDRYKRQSRQMENASPVVEPSSTREVNKTSRQIPVQLPPQIPPYKGRSVSADNMPQSRPAAPVRQGSSDESINTSGPNSSRYKRRSVVHMDSSPVLAPSPAPVPVPAPSWSQVVAGRHNFQGPLPPPAPMGRPVQHSRTGSNGENPRLPIKSSSARNSTYGYSSTQVDVRPTTAPSISTRSRTNVATPVNSSAVFTERPHTGVAANKPAESQIRPNTSAGTVTSGEATRPIQSPAVQQLSALSEKASQKGVKSRLRRAFSFGSSQELRKASAENNLAAEKAKIRKEKFGTEQDEEEDAAVAAKQEASGLGNSIYSGQGKFANSTDNISMASTASSASIMLRNIGKGMKKSTRNLRALFRPKSVIGVPGADGSAGEAAASVSLVTVEAERENGNMNSGSQDKVGNGPVYTRQEQNSTDAPQQKAIGGQTTQISRKSIVGNDRERAEVLAAVKKGILKRSGTSSTSSSPSIPQGEMPLPALPSEASISNTPERRVSGESSDGSYFITGQNMSGSTRSLPATVRNISFNTKVQFFDVWSPNEYDRRGDIATCNRLTPMLAQQIKEELNSFKMEMEVHEESKPHTHFF